MTSHAGREITVEERSCERRNEESQHDRCDVDLWVAFGRENGFRLGWVSLEVRRHSERQRNVSGCLSAVSRYMELRWKVSR
jgi:hypothetical protein